MTNMNKKVKGFSSEEREAMQERAKELTTGKGEGEKAVLDKIAAMKGLDRILAEKLHTIITKNAPGLTPKTWYGMPAYANKTGKVVCFFQGAERFKTRYLTLGFSDMANLDEGNLWPVSFALTKLTGSEEEKITALIKKAVR